MIAIRIALSIALITLLQGYANAGDVYRCKDADGKTTFSDRPCEGETEVTREAVKPASGKGGKTPRKSRPGIARYIDRAENVKVEEKK